MKKHHSANPPMDWRITLRAGMAPTNRTRVKVFLSATAFNGYVSALRTLGVTVSFDSPFVAICAEAA